MQAETAEYCSDRQDNDCDGFVDNKDSDCRSGTSDGCGCTTSAGLPSKLLGLAMLLLVGLRFRRNR